MPATLLVRAAIPSQRLAQKFWTAQLNLAQQRETNARRQGVAFGLRRCFVPPGEPNSELRFSRSTKKKAAPTTRSAAPAENFRQIHPCTTNQRAQTPATQPGTARRHNAAAPGSRNWTPEEHRSSRRAKPLNPIFDHSQTTILPAETRKARAAKARASSPGCPARIGRSRLVGVLEGASIPSRSPAWSQASTGPASLLASSVSLSLTSL
jgi:hypothetical protein